MSQGNDINGQENWSRNFIRWLFNSPAAKSIGVISGIAAVLTATISGGSWLLEGSDRKTQRHYVAWTQINTSERSVRGGDGGRRDALEDLNNSDMSLSGAPLSHAILPFLELSEANLDRVNLINADLFGANLRGADLWGGDLESATLKFAHLQGTNFFRANLQYACLQGAHLERGYFSYMDMKWSNSHNFHLKSHIKNVDILSSLVNNITVSTNMREANLIGVNLEGANLEGANLESAVLINAQLNELWPNRDKEEVKKEMREEFVGLEKFNDDFQAYCKALNIDCPNSTSPWRTNLTDANLTNAHLEGADLTGANLTSANLTNAHLEGADLTDAIGADLTGANLCYAIMPNHTRYKNESCSQEQTAAPTPKYNSKHSCSLPVRSTPREPMRPLEQRPEQSHYSSDVYRELIELLDKEIGGADLACRFNNDHQACEYQKESKSLYNSVQSAWTGCHNGALEACKWLSSIQSDLIRR